MHGSDDIGDGTDVFEVLRLDALAGEFLQLDRKIDGVNAVEIEVSEELSFRRDASWFDFKGVVQDGAQFFEDVLVVHGDAVQKYLEYGLQWVQAALP